MRSLRDRPEPLSSTSSGQFQPFRLQPAADLPTRARRLSPGGSLSRLRNSWRAMTLLLNLLMSRTISPSVGGFLDSPACCAPAGALPVAHAAAEAATEFTATGHGRDRPPARQAGPRRQVQGFLTAGCREAAAEFDGLAAHRRFDPARASRRRPHVPQAQVIADAQTFARRLGNHVNRSCVAGSGCSVRRTLLRLTSSASGPAL
jgi:hypothetical protein